MLRFSIKFSIIILLLLIIFFFLFPISNLKGKKIIILLEEGVNDIEFIYPKIFFKISGADVKIVAPTKNKYRGEYFLKFKPDTVINYLNLIEIDALIIPGGKAPEKFKRDSRILEIVQELNNKNKIIAAICHGPLVLISAQIAKGKKITGYHTLKDEILLDGGKYVNRKVVVDGNIITSRHPGDLRIFCKTIAYFLKRK